MKEIKEKIKDRKDVVEMRFTMDPNFKDPLLSVADQFEEVEIEEINYYYKVHLGMPLTNVEHGR